MYASQEIELPPQDVEIGRKNIPSASMYHPTKFQVIPSSSSHAVRLDRSLYASQEVELPPQDVEIGRKTFPVL